MPLILNENVPLVDEETVGAVQDAVVPPGAVTTGGVTTGVVGATPPLLVVATEIIKAFDSGEVSVGSALKVVVSVVRLAVCEVVATVAETTAAKFFTALTKVAAVVGNAPLLACESAAMALTLSRIEAVGAA